MNLLNSILLKSQGAFEKIEYQIVIDIGMVHTKIGTSLDNVPFRIVPTPADVFLNPLFFDQDNTKIFKPYSSQLQLKIHDFLYRLFFEELLDNPSDNEVIIGLNLFVPNHYILAIDQVMRERFKAKGVFFVPTQIAPMYVSNNESGIIIDFGFTNFSVIPFYKGYPLKAFIRSTRKSGAQFYKRFYKSITKVNTKFEELSFGERFEMMNELMVEYLTFSSLKEVEVVESEGKERDLDKMRNKIIKHINEKMSIYINFLENFRVTEYMFSDSGSIAIDILDALLEIPSQLRDYLVNNVLVTGGFVLLNTFMKRLKDELDFHVKENPHYKSQFSPYFVQNFYFTTIDYPTNLISWAGRKLISFLVLQAFEE